jgi:hypothetical protein
MKIDYTEYNALVNETKAKIAAAPLCTIEESRNALDKAQDIMDQFLDNAADVDRDEFKRLINLGTLALETNTLADLQKTVELDLMKVETRYLLTGEDEQLCSPAGFSPRSKVFMQTRIAIHTDKLPANLSGLSVHDMDKIDR